MKPFSKYNRNNLPTEDELNDPSWWEYNADQIEIEEAIKPGQWWVGWGEVELEDGTLIQMDCEGSYEGRDIWSIENIRSIAINLISIG